jgi:predicted methyltransferase
MKNVVRVAREFDDPLPPSARELDAVFDALKHGGVYAIIDHSGRAGTGAAEVQTLHRIEEKIVRDEILSAGFRLAAEGQFLRNPGDARDWNDAPRAAAGRRGTSDRFVLKFVKP